jgi:phage recombination protein Bet
MNAPSTALTTLTNKLATALDMGDGAGLIETLKATAFKGQVSDAQMTALLIVANQYGLNPWTKEIYAFPDKNNGIVPVVGVDGWSRIINKHPQFDGMDFAQNEVSCTCTIHRKDRSHPTAVTEYMVECARDVGPWKSHPYRMLRHKAMIQCARLAFGFVGIYEQDEAERIVETVDAGTGEISTVARKPAVQMPQARSATPRPQASTQDVSDAAPKGEPQAEPQERQQPADASACSAGEIAYITKKLEKHGVTISQARETAGLDAGDTLDGLTKDGFVALKDIYK